MKKVIILAIAIILSGCASYKIVPDDEGLRKIDGHHELSIERQNQWPEGMHCFEPMMYLLSMGIIPTHCVDTYRVSSEDQDLGTVKVTKMQGWVPLFMVPLPSWNYGFGTEKDIQQGVRVLTKVGK